MSDTPRDEQFKCFARLLIEDMEKDHALRMDIVQPELERMIAQRAYDLMEQGCIAISNAQMKEGVRLHSRAMLRNVPDMRQWPEEEQ